MSKPSDGRSAADNAGRPATPDGKRPLQPARLGRAAAVRAPSDHRAPRLDLRDLSAAISDPCARLLAQINEAGTRLHAALGRIRGGQAAGAARGARFEPLERRAMLAATSADLAIANAITGHAVYAANEPAPPAAASRPAVTSTTPGEGATDVLLDAFVSVNLSVPNGGIDATTLTAATVKLYRTMDAAAVAASVNTSAGGDVLALGPSAPLEPNTDYTFEVSDGLRDVAGNAFVPFVAHFRTGVASSNTDASLTFEKVPLATPKAPYTGVTMGPDGRLYAGTERGEIVRFDVRPDGTLAGAKTIRSLIDANGGRERLLTGIVFDPASTKDDLVVWATHSEYAVDNGADWTGKVTRLSGPELGVVQDYVVGLPRSTRDHVTNQLVFGPDGAAYFPQPSNTAMGAPDYAWHYRREHVLSAAILRLDVSLVRDRLAAGQGPLDVKSEDGGTYDPAAPGSPLTVYAHGVRNAYDLLWHSSGNLYAPTNGSQRGGATPGGPGVPAIGFVDQVENDYLFKVDAGGYYGHPNPSRGQYTRNGGNPTAGPDPYEVPQYPVGTQPGTNYRLPAFDFGQHYSPNGVIEYRGGAFAGALDGRILVARFSGGNDIAVLTVGPGGGIVDAKAGLEGLKNFSDPVDLTEDLRTGYLYIAEYGGQRITLVRPKVGGAAPGAPAPKSQIPLGPVALNVQPAGKGQLELRWADSVGEIGYKIERSADGGKTWSLAGNTTRNETRYLDTGLPRGRTYTYRVRAINDLGTSKPTANAAATTLAVILPAGWTGTDIGGVGARGTADHRDGVFELTTAGGDVDGTTDTLFFANMPASGDVEVVARVTGIDSADAKAGVMIRAASGAESANAFMTVMPGETSAFQARAASSGTTAATAASGSAWLRLVRRGDLVSGYTSPDGITWTRVAFARVALGETALVGLAFASRDPAKVATATFDNVRVNAASPLPVPEQPTDLTATVNGTRVDLAWRDNAGEETAYAVERRRSGAGEDAWVRVANVAAESTSYADEHLTALKKYDYRIVAINPTGASAPSNEASARTPKSATKGQVPFGPAPAAVPGVIEAEAFDEGPKGKAWKDRTPENDLGAFRDTGVDLAPTSDPAGGGYEVAAAKGEWLEYTVAAPADGTYAIELRYAAADGFGGSARLDVDGKRSSTAGGALTLPSTGGWSAWQTAAGAINLKAGAQVLRLSVDSSSNSQVEVANVNWMKLSPAPPGTVATSAPLKKAPQKARAARVAHLLFSDDPPITIR